MSKLWRICLFPKKIRNDAGFSLIEMMLALSIGAIILLALYSTLGYTTNACHTTEKEDEILLNGRYALEYIKREIRYADEIIDIRYDRFRDLDLRYKDNIGFVIMNHDPDNNQDGAGSYNFSTYYIRENMLYRIAVNTPTRLYPRASFFGGYNIVAEHVIFFKRTDIDSESKAIDLHLVLKSDKSREMNFNSTVKIRCPVIH